jgi:rhamnose transport system permease protein
MLLLTVGLACMEPRKFATMQNVQDVAVAASIPCLLALGATLVIASGGIDVSVGSILALSAALCGLTVSAGGAAPVAVGVAVAAGAALGGLNATIASIGRIHTIVVTLAMLGIYRGVLRVVTNEQRIQDFPPAFRALTEGWSFGIRPLIGYAALVVLAGAVFLRSTRSGRSLLAVGDSPSAARRIGLSQAKLRCLAFALSGALAGLAGAFWASSYGIVDTYTAEGYELKAIAAAVLGGCAITGGTGTALGAALGALLLELIRSALVILGASAYWESFCIGLLILGVVVLDSRLQGMRP